MVLGVCLPLPLGHGVTRLVHKAHSSCVLTRHQNSRRSLSHTFSGRYEFIMLCPLLVVSHNTDRVLFLALSSSSLLFSFLLLAQHRLVLGAYMEPVLEEALEPRTLERMHGCLAASSRVLKRQCWLPAVLGSFLCSSVALCFPSVRLPALAL